MGASRGPARSRAPPRPVSSPVSAREFTRELVSFAVAPAAPAFRVIARTSSGSHPTRTYPPTDTYPLTDAYYPLTRPPTRSPQFNLDVVELDAHAKSLQPWRSKRAPDAGRLPPLILEVYVSDLGPAAHAGDAREEPARGESDSRERGGPRVLIERWVLRHDDDDDADTAGEQGSDPRVSSKPGRTNAETVAVAYKRTVVMVRALHALCRSLPANRFHKAARRSQCRGLRFAMAHEVRTGGGGGDVTVRDGDVTVQEKPSGGDFGEYSFTPVRTPAGGSLRATVFFLNADKLAGMDCVPTPTAPRVIDGYLGGGAAGGGSHPRAGPFLPSSASTSPFSPASADAPAPPRRDFGFGTSPAGSSVAPAAAVPPSTSSPAARPSRQNSWAGKATYGFGASPERAGKGASSNTLSLNTPAARGDDRARGDLPRAGSRGMLSEAIAEQKASEEGGAESARTEGGAPERGESSVNRSSTKPPPSPPHQIYGFGVGSLGTATNTTNAAGSPSLPFASTSQPTRFTPSHSGGSGPRGGGFSTSLASGDHALARRAREFGRGGGDQGWSGGGGGGGSRPQSARGGVDDSPPWHFRGFSGALSGSSPGSTPGGGTTPRGSHGSHGPSGGVGPGQSNSGPRSNPIGVYYAGSPGGGRPRRPSWSSPSSSLSASLHGDVTGGGIGSLVGGALSAPLGSSPGRPYSYGGVGFNGAPHSFNGAPYSFNGAPYSYGASPGASPGGSFANAMAHLRAQRAGQGAGSGVGVAIQPGFNSTYAGDGGSIRRIPDSYGGMFESADSDPLPFALDDDDEGGPGFDHGGADASTGGKSSQTGSPSVDSPDRRDRDREGSSFGMVGGGGRSDAAVGALVRMLQDAAPLSAEWGDERRGAGERGDGGWGAEGGASELHSSRGEADGEVERASSSGEAVGGEMTLDWALSQLSRFRDFKASLDESTSTLEAVEERPNGEEGGTE